MDNYFNIDGGGEVLTIVANAVLAVHKKADVWTVHTAGGPIVVNNDIGPAVAKWWRDSLDTRGNH